MTRRSRRNGTTAADNEEEVDLGTPLRYAPLCEVYSATSPCSEGGTPPLVHVYSRRRPSRTDHSSSKPSFFDSLVSRFGDTSEDSPELVAVKEEPVEEVDMDGNVVESLENGEAEGRKRNESLRKDWLGPIKGGQACLDTNMMELQVTNGNTSTKAKNVGRKRKRRAYENGAKANGNGPVDPTLKKWVRLSFDGVEPEKFIGLKSKVYWPLDDDWYDGQIVGYNAETGRHQVSYEDGDKENVIISIEKIKFHVSPDEMQRLNLKHCTTAISDGLNFNELVVLVSQFGDKFRDSPELKANAEIIGNIADTVFYSPKLSRDCSNDLEAYRALEASLGSGFSSESLAPKPSPMVLVIIGPSGVGKDAINRKLREVRENIHFVVTATSRAKRAGEIDGKEDFLSMVERDELLEYALVYGDYKGIPKQQIREYMAKGYDIVLRVVIRGCNIEKNIGSIRSFHIFLVAESEPELVKRLIDRRTETKETLMVRVATAREEIKRMRNFYYVVVNAEGKLEEAVDLVGSIIDAEKAKVRQRTVSI